MASNKKNTVEQKDICKNFKKSGEVYSLGFIGAAVYFIQHATSFWGGVLGLLKAMVWPAFIVYELLKFLKL